MIGGYLSLNLVCLSASNIARQNSEDSTSYKICRIVIDAISKGTNEIETNIIELKNRTIQPCVGCGKCFASHRCVQSDDFNRIYAEIIKADLVFIVSPHYAPIPAKLTALLEKMEQVTFLHWGKDHSYQSEVFEKPVGIISHGGGDAQALKSYKRMVNDTIANALDTIQMRVIPFSDEWNTGISLPVKSSTFHDGDIFPAQEYDWDFIVDAVSKYVDQTALLI